jgi:hypothetical protein
MSLLARGLRRRQSGGGAVDVSEVFSTTLYTGNGSTQTITNGIDLAGQGGMIWAKRRNGTNNHVVVDSKRSDWQGILSFNSTGANSVTSGVWEALANGYKINAGFAEIFTNSDNSSYVSWTFRKAERFFDVVTTSHTNGSVTNISLSGLSTPGMVIAKITNTTDDWIAWHRSLTASNNLRLNTTAAQTTTDAWLSVSGTTATLSSSAPTGTYVIYAFAHDPDGVIQCGSFTVPSPQSANINVNLGWEPQYILLFKDITSGSNWQIHDAVRGMSYLLYADLALAEGQVDFVVSSATGFTLLGSAGQFGSSQVGHNGIYLVIKKAD